MSGRQFRAQLLQPAGNAHGGHSPSQPGAQDEAAVRSSREGLGLQAEGREHGFPLCRHCG